MNRLILGLLLLVTLAPAAHAQWRLFGPRQRPVPHFDGTQWYVGVTTGVNHTRPSVLERYSEFSLINASADTEKDYRAAGLRTGYSAGISSVLAFTPYMQVSLSAQYARFHYAYQQQYTWSDPENEVNQLIIDDERTQSLGYLEVPLRVRYAFPIHRLKPFAQAGLVYGRRLEAHTTLVSRTNDYASGGAVSAERARQTADVSDSYLRSYLGYTLGGGVMYNFGGLMLILDANYQQGLHNITDAKARYTATRHVAGLGRVPDDIKLNALSYSVSFLFPMKFLTDKTFKPVTF